MNGKPAMLKCKLYFLTAFFAILLQNAASDIYTKFHQRDYKIDFQRVELDDYNKSAFNFMEYKTFKYNRTFPALNITFKSKINISTGLEVVIEMYKFLSNEYRIMPGTQFQINVCKTLKENLGGIQNIYKCGNLLRCQVLEGKTYKICNAYPDESRFPPYLPNGEYRLRGKFILRDDKSFLFDISGYIKIYRPIAIPT